MPRLRRSDVRAPWVGFWRDVGGLFVATVVGFDFFTGTPVSGAAFIAMGGIILIDSRGRRRRAADLSKRD